MTWYFTENWKAYTFIVEVTLWETLFYLLPFIAPQTRTKKKFNHNKCLDPGTF